VLNVFNRYYKVHELEEIIEQFSGGFSMEVSDTMSAKSYLRSVKEMVGLTDALLKVVGDAESPEAVAAAVEFILEGLHVNKRLNKTRVEGKTVYRR
jgi:magnesium chelatase subunit I